MLELRLVTVSFDTESGAFPAEPLADVPGEVVSVVEHFFFHDGVPRLLLVVQYHRPEERGGRIRGRSARKADPRQELNPDEAALYDRLRVWRRGRAEADGVPPYVVLNNRELAAVARHRPTSLATLREVEGIGQNKAQRYGPDLLRVIAASVAAQDSSAEQGDDPA